MQLNGKSIYEEREGRIRDKSRAYINIVGEGEGEVEKALKLSGSEMDGHKLVVTALWLSLGTRRIRRNQAVAVTGYDTSLPSKLIKSALRKHFSSCVEVTNVFFVPKKRRINTTKGPKRVRDMGGWPLQNGRLAFFGYIPPSERLANPNWREQMIESCREKLMIQKKMAQAAEDNDAKEDGPSSSSRL
uniref:Uncharacterized protein n=1 Tax=Noccaea caerulescens TaxID=107243 RepID=A0A1J3J9K0_NOCCA